MEVEKWGGWGRGRGNTNLISFKCKKIIRNCNLLGIHFKKLGEKAQKSVLSFPANSVQKPVMNVFTPFQ